MSRLAPALVVAALTLTAAATASVRAGAPPFTRPEPRPHEIGWVCLTVSDTRIAQASSFNKDAERLSVWVTADRFHVVVEGEGPQGRVCIPAVVSVGDGDIPENTMIFERELVAGKVKRPSLAELVLTPKENKLAEATVKLIGIADQWRSQDGVWTFNAPRSAVFVEKVERGLPGDGDGPPPAEIFRAAPAMERFEEGCQPFELTSDTVGSLGVQDRRTGLVSPRGVEPFRLKAGAVLSRCETASTDGTLVAVAQRLEGDELAWFLVPRESEMRPLEEKLRFSADKPLGGYHVCRTPTWTSALLEEVDLTGKWELMPNGEWVWLGGEHRDVGKLAAGMPVILLDHRDSWALVRVTQDGVPRILALPGRAVAVPSGPASEVRSLVGGLCQWPTGEWRAVAAGTRAFRVAQDAPGAELAGLWVELPQGTRVLALCQAREGACEPILVGGAQVPETERVMLVRFAEQLLGVRQSDLREQSTGDFELRRERNAYVRPSPPKADIPAWALGLGPGARLSFAREDDFAWAIRTRLQGLGEGLAFEGAFGVGGDGHGSFIELTGGAGMLFHRIPEANLELRGALLGKIDLRLSDGGGLGVDVIAKGQLRWVNEWAPVSLELGVNLGFGGTFGDKGTSGATFGLPMWLNVELVQF